MFVENPTPEETAEAYRYFRDRRGRILRQQRYRHIAYGVIARLIAAMAAWLQPRQSKPFDLEAPDGFEKTPKGLRHSVSSSP